MHKRMKVLVAYDGSSYANAAIDNLPFAGLPREGEIQLISVTNTIQESLSNIELVEKNIVTRRVQSTIALMKDQISQSLQEMQELTVQSAKFVQDYLPNWQISNEVVTGIPAPTLVQKANDWNADLIIVGSHGRSAVGRFFLGSVSQEIAMKANCAVRIVKQNLEMPLSIVSPKILAVVNNSFESEQTIRAIGNRVWEDDTEICLFSVDYGGSPNKISPLLPDAMEMFEWAKEKLSAIGLKVSIEITRGNPKSLMLEKVSEYKPDSVFIAARGFTDSDQILGLDPIVEDFVNNINCPIEIVRSKTF